MARYPLGAAVTLSTKVTDPTTGLPADPTDISLQLRLPDGSTVVRDYNPGPVVRDSVGAFHDVLTTGPSGTLASAGLYQWAWITTGSAPGAVTGVLQLVDPFTPAHVGLDAALARLNLDPTTVSAGTVAEVQDMIASAVSEQEQRVGPVAPRVVTETVTAYGGRLSLSARPVLSLTSALAGVASTSITGWSVPSPMAGLVQSTAYLSGTFTVTYVAGRNPVPADLVEAALLRVQHSYATQRGGSGGGQIIGSASTDAETGADSSDFLLMLRARDKEASYVLPVIA